MTSKFGSSKLEATWVTREEDLMKVPHATNARIIEIPERTARFVFLLLAITHVALWELTRSTDDVPLEDLVSWWFMLAAAACLVTSIRYNRRTLPVATSLTITAYMSRVACVVAGVLSDQVLLSSSRVWITIVVWSLLSFFMTILGLGFIKSESRDRTTDRGSSDYGTSSNRL